TDIDDGGIVQRGDYGRRNIYYGVREHAMAATANGMVMHGGLRPFVGTFLIFSDYLRPSLRLGALMDAPVIYVFTHDSIGLGGDGPTHQPVAALMSLRAIPNVTVIRPADANETAQAWVAALKNDEGPTALVFSRQNLPVLQVPTNSVAKGAYIIADADGAPDVILIGTGSEVYKCLEAKEKLDAAGIRANVVSMPSFELFEAQSDEYKERVLPHHVKARVAVEAGASQGWYKYVGLEGAIIGLDHFGASGEGDVIMEKFGFTAENIARTARRLLK
ncbi:MAG TPA: transketolase C-terminal domain-containing protein, partial [Chloroflexota bacterium]|nr:transketolase C-terminal domain-containing protein [Chloroflexota bacterium]